MPSPATASPADDELRRLRAENYRLKAERDLLKSRRLLRQPPDLIFDFIDHHQKEWPIAWMCDALEISTSRCRWSPRA